MKTIEINLYSFDELSKEAKEKALSKLYDINVDFDWYQFTYEDAKNIGLQITGFDLDRNKHATGELLESAYEVAQMIMNEHGKKCDTYTLAKEYIADYNTLVEKYSDGINKDKVTEENEYDFDNDADELEQEFKRALLEEYASILQKEYEYQTSEEAIKETIAANEYTFETDGTMNNG